MTVRAWLWGHLAAAGMLGLAASVSAQITTGTVTGTVKDEQGGVVPGATVTLISETQGTRSSPVVTDATGRFRVPERAGRYLHDRSLDAVVQDPEAAGVHVSPGERVVVAR